jgi:hypothetical protein
MRLHLVYAALGLAGAFGVSAAQAQTVITNGPAPVGQPPLVTAPALVPPGETVRTTRTVHTVRTLVPVHQRIVTTRTVTRRVMPPEPAVVAPAVAAAPAGQPLYDVAPAPAVTPAADVYAAPAPAPAYDYNYAAPGYGYAGPPADYGYGAPGYGSAPAVYDVAPAAVAPAVAPAPAVTAPVVAPAPFVATQPVIYRYVYETDRILVIDPITNIAVQAIPR